MIARYVAMRSGIRVGQTRLLRCFCYFVRQHEGRGEWRVTKVVNGRVPRATYVRSDLLVFLSHDENGKKGRTSVVQTHPRWWLTAGSGAYLRGLTGEGNRLIHDTEPARLSRPLFVVNYTDTSNRQAKIGSTMIRRFDRSRMRTRTPTRFSEM